MKNIKVTNKIYKIFLQVWDDNSDYREKYPTPSKLIHHLIEIAEGEGFY